MLAPGLMVKFDGDLVPGVCQVAELAGRVDVTVQAWTSEDLERLGEMSLAMERRGSAAVQLEVRSSVDQRTWISSAVNFHAVSTPVRLDSQGLYEMVFAFRETPSA